MYKCINVYRQVYLMLLAKHMNKFEQKNILCYLVFCENKLLSQEATFSK